ncbi:MAG: magnesium chelatase subunit D family protein [Actinomycetota bacterium]|nr:magnesium chelatase subunit D family protein [Actinomycetota bacterium]
MPNHFPFSAIVGSDDMALALALTTISPAVGGVLVRGEKGTAKSTMVRALAHVLPPIDVIAGDRFSSDPREHNPLSPDGPFPAEAPIATRPVRLVELPVGATEDRVLGSLHLEKALAEGITEYEPGLLARANRGILYVDEVNLLHDHLVDLLLDAAAMGSSTVERDGVSVAHAAKFVLVGTMNPEEGELRPQLLDRFGLTVEVAAPRDPQLRVEVVKRRIAYENDPEGFSARYAEAESELTDRIRTAQDLLDKVELSDEALYKIAEVCAAFEVDGMRADIVTARAAVAHAAWNARLRVTREDIRAAARLAIPHRRRRNPFDAPGIDEDLLDQILGDTEPPDDLPPEDVPPDDDFPPHDQPESNDGGAEEQPPAPSAEGPGQSDAESNPDNSPPADSTSESDQETEPTDVEAPPMKGEAPASVVAPQQAYRPKLFSVSGMGAGESGRRSRAITTTGRRIGAERARGQGGSIHLTETIRAAAPHQHARGRKTGAVQFKAEDLRVAVKEGHESNLILFCVDASGSMAARARMEQVKTAIISLLLDAYQRRDKVGLITFRQDKAELALPPTSSVDIAAARMRDLPAGGRTPLAEGLLMASQTLSLERIRDPRRRPLLVVITDGRATYGQDALGRSKQVARHLGQSGVASLVIDCESGKFTMGLARELSSQLLGEYVPLGEVAAAALTTAVRHSVVAADPRNPHQKGEVA